MDFLNKIFGSKKDTAKEIPFEEANALVKKELEQLEKEALDFSVSKFSEIKHLLSSLSKNATALSSHNIKVDEGNKRFRQIVETSKKNLARQLEGLSTKIAPPSVSDLTAVEEYVPRALKSVTADLLPYWKNISLAKIMLKEEVASIGSNIEELSSSLHAINSKVFSETRAGLKKLDSEFNEFYAIESRKKNLSVELSDNASAMNSASEQLSSIEKKIVETKESSEFKEIDDLNNEKERLEKKKQELLSDFNSEIAPIEKVLKRLVSLSESSKLLSDKEKEIANLLMTSPFSAFIADPSGISAKSVLVKAEKLVKEGSISLKDNEKDKKLSVLSNLINKDFFTDYFWKTNSIQADLAKIQKKMDSQKIAPLLKSLNNEKASAKDTIEKLKADSDRIFEEVKSTDDEKVKTAILDDFDSFFIDRYKIKK